jgi:hypothetical protein
MTNRFKNFDWLATVFYPLAVVLMEACWVYPWLVWLGSWPLFTQPRPPLSLASVIIVLAAATLAVRLFLRQKWPVSMVQAVVIGLGLVVILLVLGIEYNAGYGFLSGRWFAHIGQVFGNMFTRPDTMAIGLPALLYLWWRGINLGQTTSYFRNIYRSFLLGMVALIVLMIIWQVSAASGDFPKPGPGAGLEVIAFFFFGLLAIAISHLYMMRSSMPREEDGRTSVWRWLPIMLAVIGGMALVVFGIAGIFSAEFFASVGHGFSAIFDFLGKIINYILVPFNYLFEGIIWLLRFIINLLRSNQPLQPNDSANMSFGNLFPKTTPADIPPIVFLVIKWLVLAVIIAAVIFILAKAVSRFRARHAEEEIEEIHESLFSWRGLGNDLWDFFGLIGKKFQRKPAPLMPGYDIDDDESRRLDIREIYRHLLREADRSGLSRSRHETPVEYSGRLGRMVPESREPLTHLTDMYVGVRYGEIDAKEKQVDSANGLWRTLRGLLRGLRGEL